MTRRRPGKGSVLETLARQRLAADREREARERAREEARGRREVFAVELVFADATEARRSWTAKDLEEREHELRNSRARIGLGEPPWVVGGAKSWDDPQGPVTLRIEVREGSEVEARAWLDVLHLPIEEGEGEHADD